MSYDTQLKSAWQVRVTSKGKLVRSIQYQRTEITAWIRIVECADSVVLVC
jgi:hypothetical protein